MLIIPYLWSAQHCSEQLDGDWKQKENSQDTFEINSNVNDANALQWVFMRKTSIHRMNVYVDLCRYKFLESKLF